MGALWVAESPDPPGAGTAYEAYSLLGALAVRSDGLRLGVVAGSGERRAPSILAKIVTGVDVISHGRAVLALDGDCGTPDDAERLSEALIVARAVLVDEHPTFGGRIYTIDNAVNRPAPVQSGGVPIVVFLRGSGPGRPALLDVAARLADAIVVDGARGAIDDARQAVAARDDAAVGTGAEVVGWLGPEVPSGHVATQVAALRDTGADGCIVGLVHPWDPRSVEVLAAAW